MQFIRKIKEKDIDILLLIVAILAVPIFIVPVMSGDEVWNFAFIYKMNLGYVPYNDLNIIVPPLFHLIGLIFFKILGANILSFRIYNFIIIVTFFFLTYKIFKKLKVNKKNSVIMILLTFLLLYSTFASGANYNFLAYIPILVSLLLMIDKKENYFLYGLLIFVTILIKQNIGVYFGAGIGIYIILNKKDVIKNLFKIFIVNIISILIFLFVLYKMQILNNFYFYVISGIKNFSSDNIDITYIAILIALMVFVNYIITYYIKRSELKGKEEILDNLKKMYCIGVPLVLVAYPIFNFFHIFLSIYILWISYMYILHVIFLDEILTNKLSKILIIILLIISISKCIEITIIGITRYERITDKESPYYGGIISKEVDENILLICKYIINNEQNGYNTIVLSHKANLYMVPLGKNNKYGVDLPFKGNLGYVGEELLLKTIKELENTYILIENNKEDIFWQESEKTIEYIQNNLDKIGTIEEYGIYYKK